jgi:2-desacetyl-2-hydroxyethyl bacteriochlorophyllide A dehydrogenase
LHYNSPEEDFIAMWTSTLEMSIGRVLLTQILGRFWQGAYFSSLAPLQVRNLPRQPLVSSNGNWVRVHNRLAGICGSDLHLVFANGDWNIAPAALPGHRFSYPGHEVVGEVIEIGDQVQNLRVGDSVVLQSAPNCLTAGLQPPCPSCALGNYNLCENGDLPGAQQIGGGWSEEMLVQERQLFHIPTDMEDEQAVLLEPSAVAVHAVLRCLPQAGEKVLIVGAGTIGLLTLQVLRALAPKAEVSVLAKHNFQVEQATRMGAAHILYMRKSYESVERTTGARLYKGKLGNKMLLGGYDIIFDTVGTQQTIHHTLRWTRAGGTVVLVGLSLHQLKLDLSPIWYQEVSLMGTLGHGMEDWPIGTNQQQSTFAIASELITNGQLRPEKLITHRYPLSDFRAALQAASNKKGNQAIKVVFDASLLPASSVPNARSAGRTHRPMYITDDFQGTQPEQDDDDSFMTMQTGLGALSKGPSQFTLTQSEDFTADFDNAQFVTPKPRRPPTPLQFGRNIENIPTTRQPISPASVTKSPSDALQIVEENENDSQDAPPN